MLPRPRIAGETTNIHDLLGRFPWLLNLEWQVLAEEKRITTQLREWAADEIPADTLERFDFLALAGAGSLSPRSRGPGTPLRSRTSPGRKRMQTASPAAVARRSRRS